MSYMDNTTKKRVLREGVIKSIWLATALISAVAVAFILGHVICTALSGFLFNTNWNPTGTPPSYGIAALIIDTLLVTLGALIFSVPLGLATAVYISYVAPPRMRDVVKPVIELLAGIPSVVYGFFGMIVLGSFLQKALNIPSGACWLAASIILGIMALPTIISVSEDALFAIPKDYKEASLSLGVTYWHTISHVLLPAAASGVSAAVILGMGRAIGETMAVMMIAGNAAIIPNPIWNVLSPVRTLTATLGIEMTEVATNSMHYYALFGVATILLLITLLINLTSYWLIKRMQTGSCLPDRMRNWTHSEGMRVAVAAVAGIIVVWFLSAVLGILSAVVITAAIGAWYFGREKISPKFAEKSSFGIIYACTAAVILILAIILWDIFANGLPAISWEFLTGRPKQCGLAGGIFTAIVGTLQLVAGAILITLPIGIGAAIYFTEYSHENLLTRALRIGNDLLNGTPSIVFGLFGFAFFVIYLNWGTCMLAGQICLAFMILPTIIRTTEEALKSVPNSLREASLGLGATQWQTIRKVVLPSAAPGILTGAILSVGRAAGETAPIMFTAVVFSKRFITRDVFDPVMALPYHLFALSTTVPDVTTQHYGTAVVLIALVIAIYLAAIFSRRHFQKKLFR
ncbi:MAG: phosphate ABC transporter permease PstA [Methanocalculaceae archaeon]|jgi:phosphate transport system permease protein|nr:phosphate ABC transporter permease PstA [Methanocalculaceae archaeon]